MVNWCPCCNTSISDAEVEYVRVRKDTSGICSITVKETGETLELATTRPETMLGDTAVAINGEDPRYTRSAWLPCHPAADEHRDSDRLPTSMPIWKRAPAS